MKVGFHLQIKPLHQIFKYFIMFPKCRCQMPSEVPSGMLLSSKWVKKLWFFTGPVPCCFCCVEDVNTLGYLKLHHTKG